MNTERKILFNGRIERYVRDDGSILMKDGKTWNYGNPDKNGYNRVKIGDKYYFVHRLVAETFLPNPENKPTVDHINRNIGDNSIENLRWATRAEQCENRSLPQVGRLGIRTKDRSEYNRALYKEYKAHGRCW